MTILNKKTVASLFAASMIFGVAAAPVFAAEQAKDKTPMSNDATTLDKPDCTTMTDAAAKTACENDQMVK